MSNHSSKKRWGTRSAWAMSFFDLVPSTSEAELASSSPSSSTPPASVSTTNGEKLRRNLQRNPQTRWRCRRCHSVLHPPLDVATGKPRYGVMMCEHLEGLSSGGTTYLATGVAVCAAGTLHYDKHAAASHTAETAEGTDETPTEARDSVRGDLSAAQTESGGQTMDELALARADIATLLHQCQRAALAESQNLSGHSQRAPVPLLFIVVENPKTPANAGGILRAMKCYGVHGPCVSSSDVQNTTTVSADLSRGSPQDLADVSGGVLQRVGAFLFSGTRLRKALSHTDFASTLRTDPTHAGRDIPQLCLPSLDLLFEVLKSEFGHHRHPATSSPTTAVGAAVRVVAVELVEGATPLPSYEHPFNYLESSGRPSLPPAVPPATRGVAEQESAKEVNPPQEEAAAAAAAVVQEASSSVQTRGASIPAPVVPMVFYVFGAEDATLSAHHLARDVNEVVFMPTTGSMNLAATVNVLLYDRAAKERCGLRPAERRAGQKWKDVFETRNANNRTRWTQPSSARFEETEDGTTPNSH